MTQKRTVFIVGLFAVAVLMLGAVCGLGGCSGGGGDGGNGNVAVEPQAPQPVPQTLAGTDADRDGVRDDIQQYIASTYPNSAKTRAALTQLAKAVQATLLDANDKEASIAHAHESQRAIECLYHIRPDDIRVVRGELQAQILNTDERSKAWIKADEHVSGQVFTISDDLKASCDFNPDTMEN